MNRILLPFFLLSSGIVSAQTQFWADNFEGVAPTSGTRNASYTGVFGTAPHTRYFSRISLGSINAPYTGVGLEGTQCWAAEDIDAVPTGTPGEQSSEQNVTWPGINISGKIGLSFRGLFSTATTTVWDHGTATALTDYCTVEYQIDGGGWTNLISFRPNSINNTNGALAIDNNLDGLGDGITLNANFVEFTVTIPGGGTTMDLRARFSSNALAEEVAIDNFRLLANASLPVELTDFFSECSAGRETVSWRSETERQVDYYGLERSADGLKFDPLAQIDAFGTSDTPKDYAYTIADPQSQQLYYRLRMVDTDGSFEFSKTIAAKDCTLSDGLLESFSVHDGRLECTFHTSQLLYELLTTDGRSVTGTVSTHDALQHTSTLHGGTGVYLLRVTDERHAVQEMYRIFVP